MIDRVVWSDLAVEQLSEIWLRSADRQRISATANRIEFDSLRSQAQGVVSLSEGLFRYDVVPLRVYFEVLLPTRELLINAVREL